MRASRGVSAVRISPFLRLHAGSIARDFTRPDFLRLVASSHTPAQAREFASLISELLRIEEKTRLRLTPDHET